MRRATGRPLIGVSCFALLLIASQANADDAKVWLERMNRAVQTLSYKGTFVHVVDGNAETMRIVHRNRDGKVSERLVSVDGAGREIVGRDGKLEVILPDRRTVLVKPHDGSSHAEVVPLENGADLAANYSIKLYHTARIADRTAQIVAIRPKDQYRYGYVVWLDEATAYPLKSQLRDENNRTIEQILFTQFQVYGSIPDTAVQPTIDTTGFKIYQSPQSTPQPIKDVRWHVTALPQGFRLAAATESPTSGTASSVQQLVYSDGLATVSIFIGGSSAHVDLGKGFTHVGNANVYSLMLGGGERVTVVGEVPKLTVHTIAVSLRNR